MDMMEIRHRVLLHQAKAVVNGWHSKTFSPASDLLKGNDVASALINELPASYRYAIALVKNTDSPENNAFIGAVFLPSNTGVFGFRYRNGAYGAHPNFNLSDYDYVIRSGVQITMLWRTEPISNDSPEGISWGFSSFQPGTHTRANTVKSALDGINSTSPMLSIADLDFNSVPQQNQTYCVSITNIPNAPYLRSSASGYQMNTNWTTNYGLYINNGVTIACFYIK